MVINRAQTEPPAIPPLESGDRLSRHEFERRYEAMPKLKKAELIEADDQGIVNFAGRIEFTGTC